MQEQTVPLARPSILGRCRPAAQLSRTGLGLIVLVVALSTLLPPSLLAEEEAATAAEDNNSASSAQGTAESVGEAEAEKELRYFATTTVTATGRETDSFELPTPVTVLSQEHIEERAPNSASDLLLHEPGVDVNGVGPNQARPVIRGQRGLRILFLENGLRMNNARRQTDFGEIPALVDIGSVESVEVVRGPASVLYGSDAIGGVLNLVTQVPQSGQGWSGGVDLRLSSADEQTKGRLHAGGRQGDWSWSAGYTQRDAEDYDGPSGSYGNVRLQDDTTVLDSGLEDNSFDGYLGFRANDRQAFYLRGHRYRADDAGFGFVEPELLGGADPTRIRILYPFQDFDKLTFGYQGSALSSLLADSADVQLYWQQNERNLVNDIEINIGPVFPGAPDSTVQADTDNFTDLETLGARGEFTKIVGSKQVITYGVEYWQDDSFNTDFSTTTTTIRFPFPPFVSPSVETDAIANAPNAENTSLGLFVQDEILATKRFKAIVGARYQEVETQAQPTPGWDISGLDFSDDAFVGAVNLLFAATEKLHLVGSWGRAFRAPNIVERLFNGLTPEGIGFQILNPDLRSEESENFDLGFKLQNQNAYLELFYFENQIDDGIIQHFLTPAEIAQLPANTQQEISNSGVTFVVQQRNLDRLTFEGVELSGGYRFARGFSIGGNYSWLDGERDDATNPPTGDSYATKGNLWLRWAPPARPWRMEYRLRHNGDERLALSAGEPPPVVGPELPSFTVHSLYGAWTFGHDSSRRMRHTVGLLVENLSNELYAEFSNVSFFRPAPERSVVLTYGFDF